MNVIAVDMPNALAGFDIVEILNVAFAGLALLLGFLSYRIIAAEQRRDGNARGNILVAAYVYMFFSIVLCLMNLFFLIWTSNQQNGPPIFNSPWSTQQSPFDRR